MINLTDSAENERSAMETCTYFEEVFVKFVFISCSSFTRTTASLFYPLNRGIWRWNDSQQIWSKCSKWSLNIPNLEWSFQMKFQETSRESFIETSRKSFTWNFTTVRRRPPKLARMYFHTLCTILFLFSRIRNILTAEPSFVSVLASAINTGSYSSSHLDHY